MDRYEYLFLDRDGVINIERPNDYVKNVSEFVFETDALAAIKILSQNFKEIFIITNQRGVGRGIMSASELKNVHDYMLQMIEEAGGKISNIFFCTDTDSTSINRKPNVGMAFKAKADHPEIDFKHCIMVGNSRSDIDFGNKLGMYTVLVSNKYPKGDKIYDEANTFYDNLYTFAISLKKENNF